MSDDLLIALTLVTALGCGLAAGIFFAFSTFVMKALARIPSAQGILHGDQEAEVAVWYLRKIYPNC